MRGAPRRRSGEERRREVREGGGERRKTRGHNMANVKWGRGLSKIEMNGREPEDSFGDVVKSINGSGCE